MRKVFVRFRVGMAAVMGVLAVLAFSAPAAAQAGRVIGRVTDAAGNPVHNARVALVPADSGGAARTAVTGETGGFDFAAVAPGRYTVRASAAGFRERQLRVELRPHGRETVIARLATQRGVPRLATEHRPSDARPQPIP